MSGQYQSGGYDDPPPMSGTPQPRSPWAIGGVVPGKPKPRTNASPFGMTTFDGSGNNLLNKQFNPTDSAATTRATGMANTAADKLQGFQFQGYTPVAQPTYGAGTDLLNKGNAQMQGNNYDYTGANAKYDAAGKSLADARGTSASMLNNVAGLGLNAYTGGGAAHADTSGLNAGLDQANSYIGDKFAYQGDTGDARAQALASLKTAANGPNRDELAARSLAQLESQSQPGYQTELRGVQQKSAALGRRGSAIVNQDLGTVQSAHDKMLSDARESAAIDSAGKQLSDNIDRTRLGLDVTTGFGNEDRAGEGVRLAQAGQLASNANSRFAGEATNAGFANDASNRAAQGAQAYASNQRGIADQLYGYGADAASNANRYGDTLSTQENNRVGNVKDQAASNRQTGLDLNNLDDRRFSNATSERDTARKDEYNQQGVLSKNADQFHGYQNDAQTQDRNSRNEMRDERDYQTQRSDKATSDELARSNQEEMLRNGVYNRGQGYANQGNAAPSPYGAYQNAAATAQGQANQTSQGFGDAVAGYAAGRRRTGAGTGSATYGGLRKPGDIGYDPRIDG